MENIFCEKTNYLIAMKLSIVEELVTIFPSPYLAAQNTHAIVVCTEWDEFLELDYKRIYDSMYKPAFVFDGRKMLPIENLQNIGFHVETIGVKTYRKQNRNVADCIM
ncbi:UDP-glucose 6-dehydrogenase [Araneus ventricosus]|uniref:UDP-glucose 6-dehydrogenase n=1 Tax=Araneus ventricosus TaxID=182803 RepID=A0A4Y2MW03_ARAVE|nr:UDP-glucose 6-dehydrogenase [Araneus ventricosus]